MLKKCLSIILGILLLSALSHSAYARFIGKLTFENRLDDSSLRLLDYSISNGHWRLGHSPDRYPQIGPNQAITIQATAPNYHKLMFQVSYGLDAEHYCSAIVATKKPSYINPVRHYQFVYKREKNLHCLFSSPRQTRLQVTILSVS